MSLENESPLERLNKRLYDPKGAATPSPSSLSSREALKPSGWTELETPVPSPSGKKLSPSLMFLIGAAGFFVVTIVVAGLLLTVGGRSVSTDNIRITIEGPTKVSGGDTLSLLVTIQNRNPVAITKGNLSLTFPEGSYTPESNEVLTHYIEEIGDIPAGGSIKRTVRAVVFGNEDEPVIVPMNFEYRTTQSSAVFVKKEQYAFTIGTSPVAVTVESLSEIASGQTLTVAVLVRSNAPTPLTNLAVSADLPFGFALDSASPAPREGNVFIFDSLSPGDEERIILKGTLTGQDNDERVFRFNVGALSAPGASSLGVIYATESVSVVVTRPFLAVSLLLDRTESDPMIIQAGIPVRGMLSWTNTLPSAILDGELSVRIQGAALDSGSVSGNGYYRSSDTTMVFSRETDGGLRTLQPGDEGNGTFTFSTKTGGAMESLRNPSLILTISVAGRRVTESAVPETISSTLTRTIKIASDFTLSSRGVYSVGPFTNSGPWPPRADQETTYTIILTAKNTVNSVADGAATMTLPSYVRFLGSVSPNDGKLTYNQTTREVTWNLGDVPAGTSGREVAFQVALTPSLSQVGMSPTLVGASKLVGYDRFVERQLSYTAQAVTTRIESDPAFQFSYGNVAP